MGKSKGVGVKMSVECLGYLNFCVLLEFSLKKIQKKNVFFKKLLLANPDFRRASLAGYQGPSQK